MCDSTLALCWVSNCTIYGNRGEPPASMRPSCLRDFAFWGRTSDNIALSSELILLVQLGSWADKLLKLYGEKNQSDAIYTKPKS